MADSADSTKPAHTLREGVIESLANGHAFFIAIGALFTAAINLEVFFVQQWRLAMFTGVLGMLAAAAYVLSDYRIRLGTKSRAKWIRGVARWSLILFVPVSVGLFLLVAMVPRLFETGPIMAIARFEGPPLPDPYGNCRPSDLLADTLSTVGDRFENRLNAFELPYIVDPNGRWAQSWAWFHGELQGADVVVFGEYSLVDHALGSKTPDRILITTNSSNVPTLSLGWKTAPLLMWEFPTRLVSISALCTRNSQRFLNDGRRLGLAVAGLELFSDGEYDGARTALRDAQDVHIGDTGAILADSVQDQRDSQCDRTPTATTQCSGVLAFYLGVLDQRFGNYSRAENEYSYAAAKLNRASPYINLGQLYLVEARGDKALQAFSSAVSAAPHSVAALATLSQCEYEFGDKNAAAIDLVRAKMAQPSTNYDAIALSRALFQRDSAASKQEGIQRLQRAIPRNIFGEVLPRAVDSEVDLGRWIASTVNGQTDKTLASSKLDEAIAAFRDALKVRPVHIKANYQLAIALAVKRDLDPNLSESQRRTYHEGIRRSYLTALTAQAFTDDEFTDQGNAAFALGESHLAAKLYDRAIGVNQRAVYAHSGLGEIYRRSKNDEKALAEYTIAANLHQREQALHEQVRILSQLIRPRTLSTLQPSMIARVRVRR